MVRSALSLTLAASLLGTLAAAPAAAQGPSGDARAAGLPALRLPDVAPGAISTVLVEAGAPLAAGDSASFTLSPAPGVRLFGPRDGAVDARPGETVAVPLTYAVPSAQPAGATEVARLVVRRALGGTTEHSLVAVVSVRRRLSVTLVADPPPVAAGAETRLVWRLTNHGNAPDSVRLQWEVPPGWRVRPADDVLVVAPGATLDGASQLGASDDALPGHVHTVRVTALGRGGRAQALVPVTVQEAGGAWARLPGSVLVASDGGAMGAALSAEGTVGRDTRLEVAASTGLEQMGVGIREAATPLVRMAAEAPSWRLAVGEARLGVVPLAGRPLAGLGVEGATRVGAALVRLGVLGGGAERAPDRGVFADVMAPGYGGEVGLVLMATERERVPGRRSRVVGGGLAWRLPPAGADRARVEAGMLYTRATPESEAAAGPSFDVAYEYVHALRSVAARVRRVPAGGEIAPSEASLAGRLVLPAAVTAFGWASATRAAVPASRADGAALGLDWAPGALRLSLLGSTRTLASIGGTSGRSSVTATASYAVVGGRVSVAVEEGRATAGETVRAFRATSARATWNAGASAAWLSATHESTAEAPARISLDVGARLVGRALDLDAGVGVTQTRRSVVATGWARASVSVGPVWDVLGAVHAGSSSRAQVSVGLRRRLGVPVPLRPAGAAWGRVYDDRNGNGRPDAGEPGDAGAVVHVGRLRAVTDASGRWTLRAAATQGEAAAVDPTSLLDGWLVPPGIGGAGVGRVDLPVIRAATLVLDVFEDADGDGTRGPFERGAAGVSVSVEDAAGRVRWSDADGDGRMTLTGLSPGPIALTIHLRASGTRDADQRVRHVRLEAGGETHEAVPLAPSARRIRFGG